MFGEARKIRSLVQRTLRQISRRRRLQVLGAVLLSVLASFAEVLSLGALMPFLGALLNPEKVFASATLGPLVRHLGITDADRLLLTLTVAFTLSVIASALVRICLMYTQSHIAQAITHELGVTVYRKILSLPYVEHTRVNSADRFTMITHKVPALVVQVFTPVLVIVNSAILIAIVFVALVAVNPFAGVGVVAGFGCLYLGIAVAVRGALARNAVEISRSASLVVKTLNEGLGGVRDVILDSAQEAYAGKYRQIDWPLRRSNIQVSVIGASPRIIVESIGIVAMAGVAYFFGRTSSDFASLIPVIAAFALGAQRLLPMLQQAYQSWASIRSAMPAASEALDELEREAGPAAFSDSVVPLSFLRQVELRNVAYRYSAESRDVLAGVSLTIPRGGSLGIVGVTGSGKSTLLDILMGLLEPTGGELLVDGVPVRRCNAGCWQAHIAHVPQNLFLADLTVAENIAFGVALPEIDMGRVRQAARMAQIADAIESWPGQYLTRVGERGMQLSGGQRQRLGIARALYRNAAVIVLDEATSALDSATEEAVMSELWRTRPETTFIMVAHRVSTLRNCDRIAVVEGGVIARHCRYEELAP